MIRTLVDPDVSRRRFRVGKDTFLMRATSAAFESSVLEASRASGEAALMSLSED